MEIPPPQPPTGIARPNMKLLLWILTFEIAGAAIGGLTASDVTDWYETLNRSPYNPPPWSFGVIWPILYALIAIAGFRIWQRRAAPQMKWLCALFAIQMIMNWAWSFIFFSLHLLWPAYLWISLMVAIVATMIILLWKRERISAYLLLPYLLWIAFAAYLAGYIASHNF